MSSAVQTDRASIQRVRAFRKSSETPSKSNSTPLPILKSAISFKSRWRLGSCRIAGTCAGLLITELFAEIRSFRNDRTFPAANFQFVAVGIFEEKCVVAGTVIGTDFRAFQRFAARLAHQFRDPIDFVACVGPKRDSGAVWSMMSILRESEKFRRLVAARGIKRMEIVAWFFVNKSELGQKFCIKRSGDFHVFYPQIDVIKATRFHFMILARLTSRFNRLRKVLCSTRFLFSRLRNDVKSSFLPVPVRNRIDNKHCVAALVALSIFGSGCGHRSNSVSGTIEVDEVHVGPRSGGRAEKIFGWEGDTLRVGQPIAELDASELHARRDLAEAQINTAIRDADSQEAQLQFLRDDAKRQEDLLQCKVVSPSDA